MQGHFVSLQAVVPGTGYDRQDIHILLKGGDKKTETKNVKKHQIIDK